MKVFLTGAEGFIGSHVCEALVKEGYEVKALALYNSFNQYGWMDSFDKELKDKIEMVHGDVRDPFQMEHLVSDCDAIIHMAALIAIPYSYVAPDAYVDTNVKGTLNILEAARKNPKIKRVLVTSTSEVYGTAKYVPMDEHHPYQGQSPYSASKIGADRMAEAYYRSFNVPVTIVRPFNTFGPRQSQRAIIPTLICQLLAGKEEISMGSLHPTRDFNYVKDTAAGFIAILKSDKCIGEEINIATKREISMGDLANELIRQINPRAKIVQDPSRIRPGKSEVERLYGDNSKLLELTDFKAQYTLESGLEETIEWIRNHMDLFDVDKYIL